MLRRSTGKQATVGVILTLLLFAGCGTEERTLEFTFDGNECTYSGPEKVSAGEITLVLNNQNQVRSAVDFGRFEGDNTWEDFVSYNEEYGPEPSPAKGRPSWFKEGTFITVSPGQSGTRILSVTRGTWGSICTDLGLIWSGAPVTVE